MAGHPRLNGLGIDHAAANTNHVLPAINGQLSRASGGHILPAVLFWQILISGLQRERPTISTAYHIIFVTVVGTRYHRCTIHHHYVLAGVPPTLSRYAYF